MKRLITLLVVLLVSIMPAMAEFTPYDYHIMYTANGITSFTISLTSCFTSP